MTVTPAQKRRGTALVLVFALLHLLIPLRYYAFGGGYDERFSWRMFSQLRVQSCAVQIEENDASNARTRPALERILPAPWIALLRRNRASAIDAFLRWRCGQTEARQVSVLVDCRDLDGHALPTQATSKLCVR